MQALNEPHWAPSFNSTSPLIPQGPLFENHLATASQQAGGAHTQHGGPGEQGGGKEGGGGEGSKGYWDAEGNWVAADGTAAGLQQQYQPRMGASMPLPVQDIQEGAVASLAASKQAAANGEWRWQTLT